MNAPINPALLPAPTTFAVKIVFTDGTYQNKVRSSSAVAAKALALQDARMGHVGGAFYGAVVSIEAERPP
jgi:hypothetical protein